MLSPSVADFDADVVVVVVAIADSWGVPSSADGPPDHQPFSRHNAKFRLCRRHCGRLQWRCCCRRYGRGRLRRRCCCRRCHRRLRNLFRGLFSVLGAFWSFFAIFSKRRVFFTCCFVYVFHSGVVVVVVFTRPVETAWLLFSNTHPPCIFSTEMLLLLLLICVPQK
jgi:hypothetical protein